MKKLYFILAVTIAVAGICILVITSNNESSSRAKYEKFILDKASSIPKPEKTNKEPKSADQPDMAAFQEYIMTVDPKLGYVPKARLLTSYRKIVAAANEKKSSGDYLPPVQWQGTDANMGGRTRAMMFDPNSEGNKKLWAGGVTGGLWYNNDINSAASQWVAVDDFWANLAVSCMAYDPNNTEILYVGTGEAQTARIIYRESSGVGAGIYKSSDAGQSWELMASTSGFQYITDLAVRDEEGVSVLYAAVASGTYQGVDHQSQPSDGLFRSVDNGENWEQVLPPFSELGQEPFTPADIEIASNGRIYVGTMENLNGLGGATVLFSDSGLEGSWTVYDYYNTKISNENYYKIPARTIIASSPSDPEIVYAQFSAGYNDGFIRYRGRYLAKTINGGTNWALLNSPPTDEWSTLAWHAFILKVDPTNPDVTFTGGLDLWKSENSAASFTRVSDWSLMYWGGGDAYVHADQHNIQYQPGNPTTAVFSSDGGVFLTNTADLPSPIFMERNNGYNTLQFYSCAMKPTAGSKQYIGGLQDNGTLYYNNNPLDINDMIDGGDGALCFWDNDEPSIFITSVYYNSYTAWYNGQAYEGFGGNTGTFISPADYDYKENILYANAVDFFGADANKLLRSSGIPFNIVDNLISLGTGSSLPFSHIKYSKFSPDGTSNLFVGTQAGKLYKVTNAQSAPLTVEIGSPDFPEANISCIAIGDSEDHLLVTFSNFGVSSVWLSLDGGETWQEKENNLPDMPIRWAIFHPDNEGQALLATEIGVWATNTLLEDTTEWAPATEGMANVRVDMLQLREADNTVLAASHGRGLFTAAYSIDVYTGNNDLLAAENNFNIFPNPATEKVTINFTANGSPDLFLRLTDMNGKTVYSDKKTVSEGEFTSQIDLTDLSSGVYFILVSNGKRSYSKKLLIR